MKSLLHFISLRGRAKTRPITLIGALPARKSSVVALVRAKLLSGQKVKRRAQACNSRQRLTVGGDE